ncbi:hypothetical protein EVAR_55407_1 [Eumeta japonica]|uniref:Uncharacterized protein n=1 Tax=Eumeta variegata TaxID=151549 RepID=A0A4C1YSA2_EUMVA|nr:hypothetical protein EVAR_55407_1 [Eumeta japonica]
MKPASRIAAGAATGTSAVRVRAAKGWNGLHGFYIKKKNNNSPSNRYRVSLASAEKTQNLEPGNFTPYYPPPGESAVKRPPRPREN